MERGRWNRQVKEEMQSGWRLTLFLCCIWIVTILYGELIAYWLPLWACSWPAIGDLPNPDNLVHVAVLADPQLTDRTSHGLSPKSGAFKAIKFYTDLYMLRAFQKSVLPFKPQIIIFLGDHFDGGPYLTDREWHDSLMCFKHIFLAGARNYGIDVHYLSGNHDIGYSGFHSLNPKVISRYEEGFGQRNYHFNVGQVDFVAIDAQTLDGPLEGKETLSTWDFIKNISKDDRFQARVLLTHIPLYRPDGTPCGKHRSSPIINQRITFAEAGRGLKYQNYLSETASTYLLDLLKPNLVLSGHDHDQCTVTHTAKHGPVREHTVGTVSWQQGNLYPSFMLLSLHSMPSPNVSNSEDFVSTQLCFLPKQTHIYIWYIILFVVTLFLLAIWPKNGFQSWHCYTNAVALTTSVAAANYKAAAKEKDEDRNREYDMTWDAEDSMHIMKKSIKQSPSTPADNVKASAKSAIVMRSTAKKQNILEKQPYFHLEENSNLLQLDEHPQVQGHARYKSKIGMLRIRFIFKSVLFVAAVNVPLYMMLLFKDWMDA
ncbi:uncharacterized protein C630.12 [Nymphaea colorata]|nr:uncharacterized protein C630.12 [Nymphaea colorata]